MALSFEGGSSPAGKAVAKRAAPPRGGVPNWEATDPNGYVWVDDGSPEGYWWQPESGETWPPAAGPGLSATPEGMAGLDLAYSNVADAMYEDQQPVYSAAAGGPVAMASDDLGVDVPMPPGLAAWPTIPQPFGPPRYGAPPLDFAQHVGPGLTALSQGYGLSPNVEDRRYGYMPWPIIIGGQIVPGSTGRNGR